MAVSIIAPSAEARVLVPGGTYGNLQAAKGEVTFAAAAQNVSVAVIRVPAHSDILRVEGSNAALGVNTVLEYGYEAVDGTPSDPDAFADLADANAVGAFSTPNAATSAINSPGGVQVTEDTYITVKNVGAGAATGKVNMRVFYIYNGI